MSKKLAKLSNILDIPSSDPEDARRRRLLNVLLLASAGSALVMLLVVLITAPIGLIREPGQVSILSLTIGISFLGAGIVYVINRFVSGELASTLFLIFLIAVAALSDKPEQVVNGRGLLVFVIPILFASFVLRPWASFAAAGLSSLVVAVIGLFMVHHPLPNIPAILGFFILALASWISARNLEQARKKLQKELEEKTMLLSEIHHRVKNSLQVVASLLNLQSSQVEDERIVDMFQQSRHRIRMMASVYEKLYRSENFASIDFKEYLEDVMDYMYRSSSTRNRVSMKVDVEDVVIGLDDAIPVALILNELLTNSFKHAFPGDREGMIEILFNQLDHKVYQLIYRDNGVGLPDHIDFDTTQTLGLHLIKNLAKQIEGQAMLEQNEWTTFKIEFKGYGHAP